MMKKPFVDFIQLQPTPAELHHALGLQLAREQRLEEAVAEFRGCIRHDPEYAPAHCNLGLALEDLGRLNEAIEAMREAFRLRPQSTLIQYHLAAMTGERPPAACPREYLVEFFDNYAERFDKHLVERLHYRGPQLLLEAVNRVASDRRWNICDLGCGTGLCGEAFRPIADRLIGVDLAPLMIEASRRRGVYDELIRANLESALRSRAGEFSLLLVADVFIYVGELAGIFQAARVALTPGGLFAFTIEVTTEVDYRLLDTRRYAQSVPYIERLAASVGMTIELSEKAPLRAGVESPVEGCVFVLRAG
jgi:predicted TPR repeat methyltransferase